MKRYLFGLGVMLVGAILSGCTLSRVTFMNQDTVSIEWEGLTGNLEMVTKEAQEKCAVFGRKAVFVYDDGITSIGRRLANFKCVPPQKKITGKTLKDHRIDKPN